MKKYWYVLIPVVVVVTLLLAWYLPLSTTTEVLPVSVNVTADQVIGVP